MPTFCRHNRLIQNCPICSKEQDVEMRPVVSPGGHTVRPSRPGTSSGTTSRAGSSRGGPRGSGGLTVRRLSRSAEDGFRSRLVPGLRSGADAQRLAEEMAFAATRLDRLETDPPGLYAEVADPSLPIEERTWLAFLIAYLGPLDGDAPFAGIEQARTSWASGEAPRLDDVPLGPRTAHEPGRGQRTVDAYRQWTQRSGSQEAAFTGEGAWAPERRFARVFERLALPGLHRGARFDLLATLGQLGVYELSAGALGLGGGSETVTLAAKRVLGIGDPLLLERRAADLAAACELPLEALDLGLFNWERGSRSGVGLDPQTEPDPELLSAALAALGV
ncbi:MAG: hypothetical protein ACXVR1_07025 [Solirubrobacteraceae bacterium]